MFGKKYMGLQTIPNPRANPTAITPKVMRRIEELRQERRSLHMTREYLFYDDISEVQFKRHYDSSGMHGRGSKDYHGVEDRQVVKLMKDVAAAHMERRIADIDLELSELGFVDE